MYLIWCEYCNVNFEQTCENLLTNEKYFWKGIAFKNEEGNIAIFRQTSDSYMLEFNVVYWSVKLKNKQDKT